MNPSGIDGIDHPLLGVADLEGARAAFERLGFAVTPRGRHFGWGTANHCVMFPHDYVELLGILDPSQFVNRLDVFLAERGEGLLGVAFGTADAEAVHRELGPRGLTEPPRDLARLLELPEGDVTPRFRLVHFAAGATPGLSSFVCAHLTPELLRRPEWLDHPNGAVGVEGVTVCVEDPAALAPAYRALFGAEALHAGQGRLDVRAGRHALRFLAPDRLARRYPGVRFAQPLPFGAVVTVRVRDLAATRLHLLNRAVPLADVPGARLVVPPEAACGVALEFATD